MAKTFTDAELELFRNRPVRREPVLILDGERVSHLPRATLEEKMKRASLNLSKFWNTPPLKNFWRSVYIHYRDAFYGNKKGGTHGTTSIPPSDNHDGNPAA